jgi:hypothetical protein
MKRIKRSREAEQSAAVLLSRSRLGDLHARGLHRAECGRIIGRLVPASRIEARQLPAVFAPLSAGLPLIVKNHVKASVFPTMAQVSALLVSPPMGAPVSPTAVSRDSSAASWKPALARPQVGAELQSSLPSALVGCWESQTAGGGCTTSRKGDF